mmetsp:Transcript_30867/g.51074  ORF Transcript_30867/g.51074 Transcript_30867/m.51074 type:complete len:219 (+) Transcript_30867:450-1106(+)
MAAKKIHSILPALVSHAAIQLRFSMSLVHSSLFTVPPLFACFCVNSIKILPSSAFSLNLPIFLTVTVPFSFNSFTNPCMTAPITVFAKVFNLLSLDTEILKGRKVPSSCGVSSDASGFTVGCFACAALCVADKSTHFFLAVSVSVFHSVDSFTCCAAAPRTSNCGRLSAQNSKKALGGFFTVDPFTVSSALRNSALRAAAKVEEVAIKDGDVCLIIGL